jgi:hypothetical protein
MGILILNTDQNEPSGGRWIAKILRWNKSHAFGIDFQLSSLLTEIIIPF